jgi:hypothetical protein
MWFQKKYSFVLVRTGYNLQSAAFTGGAARIFLSNNQLTHLWQVESMKQWCY